LVAQDHYWISRRVLADAGHDVVRQRLRQVDAVDLGAERTGNGIGGQHKTGLRVHGDLAPDASVEGITSPRAGNCSTNASSPSSPATSAKSCSSALTNAVAKRGSRSLCAIIAPVP